MANYILGTLLILFVVVSHCKGQGFPQFSNFKREVVNLGYESDAYTEAFPAFVSPQEGLKGKDKIERLPGQPDGVNFNQYSGHVTVDSAAGRALYYYFVESPQNSNSKPLLLWLTGEPGCSAFGLGAMTEIGPFRVNEDGKTLYYNPYAWTNEANIIFLEAPIGVGFSYSNTSSDYKLVGDDFTVQDSYTFVLNWFERFPEYKNRDFFIAGITNGATIVIKLAHQLSLHANNKYSDQSTASINIKGIAVGNPFLSWESWWKGTWDYAWTHALVSDEIYSTHKLYCKISRGHFITYNKCDEIFRKMVNITYDVNPFDIYSPSCNYTWATTSTFGYGPCSTNYVLEYLRDPEVQIALHANMATIPYAWEVCNFTVNFDWSHRSKGNLLQTIKLLMENGIPVWIYSGDTNRDKPVTATKYAIHKLGLSVTSPWFSWYLQNEVGGYAIQYEKNLTFVTIRGAGVFVADTQPARALAFFTSFINGELPPSV